jgi:transposase
VKEPQRIELSQEEREALLQRLESRELQDSDYQLIVAMVETIDFLSLALEQKNISIKRLRRIIFGDKTEKTANVLKDQEGDEKAGDGKDLSRSSPQETEKKKRKGHGRNGAEKYRDAERVKVAHATLKAKDRCPACLKGKLYPMKKPSVIVRIAGKAPLQASIYELERLRCNLCGKVFAAEPHEGCADKKYDETAGSIIAVLRYGFGFPFNRLEKLQDNAGIPLPASTQWQVVEGKADRIYPVYNELVRQGAQGEVLHNDDTPAKILELMASNEDEYEQEPGKESRTGIFTTAIISKLGEHKIALFYSGRNHAGENMNELLTQREAGRSPPIQMCDALSRNVPKDFEVILANCNIHARRYFVDIAGIFPVECTFVLETFKQLYKNEAQAKKQKMSPEQRLEFHQTYSGPLMEQLKSRLEEQLAEKKVEPNSSLGQAFSYMLNHWTPLTRFLRVPNAPLDNNIAERCLKMAIRHRRNSLFYKTLHGANIGDLYMSIIHTCNLCGVNALEYLTILEKHSADVFKHPDRWLPWHYKQQLEAAERD